jgi:hypothetical protein
MAYRVVVNVQGVKNPITHDVDTRDAAELELAEIRNFIGKAHQPAVPWLVVMGRDIISAHLEGVGSGYGMRLT